MAGDLPEEKPEPKADATETSVQQVIDGFLAHCEGRVSSGCLRNYRTSLSPFADRYGSVRAEALSVAQAETFVKRPDWSPSYRNDILGSLVSAFRWAEREGLITRCPLQGLRKPPKASRGAKALVIGRDPSTASGGRYGLVPGVPEPALADGSKTRGDCWAEGGRP
jgi:hypothetical protein